MQPFPLPSRKKTCNLRVVLHYDPDYRPVNKARASDPVKGDRLRHEQKGSDNAGVHPRVWFNLSAAGKRTIVEAFKAEKKGFFGIENRGRRSTLLRDIGIRVGWRSPDPPPRDDPARTAAAPAAALAQVGHDHAEKADERHVWNLR